MSGIARLLRWAPCLWAISKLAQSSGQAQRTQILTSQSPQHSSGPQDLLHTLSFTAKTVVRQSHLPRASRASTPTGDQAARLAKAPAERGWRVPDFLRYRGARQYNGFRWKEAPLWPIPEATEYARRVSDGFYSLALPHSRPPRSKEAEQGLLISVTQLESKGGRDCSTIIRLVSKAWESKARQAFWETRWFNVRPRLAYWRDIGERVRTLSQSKNPSWKVKLGSGPTDIEPITQGQALQLCPELRLLANCNVREVKVSSLDILNEVLLKMILLHHSQRIEHFAFAVEDCALYLGRRSIFPNLNMALPELKRITVDISNASQALPDALYGNSAGPVAFLVSELVGRDNREEGRSLELRLYCMPQALRHANPTIDGDHTTLARRIVDFVRMILHNSPSVELVAVFEALVSLQIPDNRRRIENWAQEGRIVLQNAPV